MRRKLGPTRPTETNFVNIHGSRCTIELVEVCEAYLIIPIRFVSHTTHLYQPLDSQPLQRLKHHFKTLNTEVATWSGSTSKERNFFRTIKDIRRQALMQCTLNRHLD
jgi:hypothetical protein